MTEPAKRDLELANNLAVNLGLEEFPDFDDIVRQLAEFRATAYLEGYSAGENAMIETMQEF
jgi:hypothetical protein